jgi:hypothetical protein
MGDDEEIPSNLNLTSSNLSLHDKTLVLIEEIFEALKSEPFYCDQFRKKAVYKDTCMKCPKMLDCSQIKSKEENLDSLEWLLDAHEDSK